jgi:hypothetical protein
VIVLGDAEVRVAGGKGRASRRAQEEIVAIGESLDISSGQVERLVPCN